MQDRKIYILSSIVFKEEKTYHFTIHGIRACIATLLIELVNIEALLIQLSERVEIAAVHP